MTTLSVEPCINWPRILGNTHTEKGGLGYDIELHLLVQMQFWWIEEYKVLVPVTVPSMSKVYLMVIIGQSVRQWSCDTEDSKNGTWCLPA